MDGKSLGWVTTPKRPPGGALRRPAFLRRLLVLSLAVLLVGVLTEGIGGANEQDQRRALLVGVHPSIRVELALQRDLSMREEAR